MPESVEGFREEQSKKVNRGEMPGDTGKGKDRKNSAGGQCNLNDTLLLGGAWHLNARW